MNGRVVTTGLFVKPPGVSEGPLQFSNAPVTTDHLRSTIIKGVEEKPVKPPHPPKHDLPPPPPNHDHYHYGPTYFEVPENSKMIRMHYWNFLEKRTEEPILEILEVIGDANFGENWHPVEEIPMKFKM